MAAAVLAQTRSAFFRKYGFEYDARAKLESEFYRLAKKRKWKPGASRKVFEKAWKECFGTDCLVDQDDQDKQGDQLALVLQLQRLELEEGMTDRERYLTQVSWEFDQHYGGDEGVLEKWQLLCRDCGIEEDPPTITRCKKALDGVYINIFDLLTAKNMKETPFRFKTRRHLARYLREYPRKRYPLDAAKENKFLAAFLVHVGT